MRLALVVLVMLAGRASADAPVTVLDGRVVGPDGKPVAGARVLGTFEWDTGASTFEADQVAAGDGAFVKRVTPSASRLRSIRVFAYAPGYSQSLELRTPPKGAKGYMPVVLRLRPTVAHTVQVIDASNVPVAAATVTIAADSFSTQHPQKGLVQPVDPAGRVTFVGLNEKDMFDLVVAAPGYLEVRYRAELGKLQTIPIARGGLLRGVLLDRATKAPVACTLKSYHGDVATDPHGRFQVVVPYGRVTLWPACASHNADHDLAPDGLVIDFTAANAGQVHSVHARHTRSVTVVVVDANRSPIAGLPVHRTHVPVHSNTARFLRHGPPFESAVTDARGQVVFRSSMDRFDLTVEAKPVIERKGVKTTDLARSTIKIVVP